MSSVTIRKSNANVNFGAGGAFVLFGDDDTVEIGDNSTLYAYGRALSIYAGGLDDVVTAGGNGRGASNADDIFVQLQNKATFHELANSRVEVRANVSLMSMAGDDALGVYGFGDTVVANGANNGVWIGQNGQNVASYAVDRVSGLKGGTLFELQGSTVAASGSAYLATMTGDDTLTALGQGVSVEATGKGNVLTIGAGMGYHSLNTVRMDGGVIYERADTYLNVTGDNLTVYTAGGDALFLLGAGDRAVISGTGGGPLVFGQGGGANQALDTLILPTLPTTQQASVYDHSNVKIVGSNTQISLGGADRALVFGSGDVVDDVSGNNAVTIGGNAAFTPGSVIDTVNLAAGDTVALLADSYVDLHTPANPGNGQFAVRMAADDILYIDNGMSVYVPVLAGQDYITNFNATDVLRLAAHFNGVADLLAHTTQSKVGTTIALDSAGDKLTLEISLETFAQYASQGLVKFS